MGAAVPLVEVTAQNVATGVNVSTQTNGSGIYDLPLLQPGTYTVTFARQGFKTAQRPNINLEIDQSAQINVPLAVGDSQQTVLVEGVSPLLDTDSSQVETVITS